LAFLSGGVFWLVRAGLVVRRELAGQLKAVGGSLQMEQWMLALAVSRSDAWFLHDRP